LVLSLSLSAPPPCSDFHLFVLFIFEEIFAYAQFGCREIAGKENKTESWNLKTADKFKRIEIFSIFYTVSMAIKWKFSEVKVLVVVRIDSFGGISVTVGNIPYDATEEQLIEICREVGPVASFRSVRKP
jgi:hypothetical protein